MADSKPRSRSASPVRETKRRRSRSPIKNDERGHNRVQDRVRKPRQNNSGGGFRWKEKRRDNTDEKGEGEKSLQRGYRKRSPPRRVEKESGASVEEKFGIAEKFGPSKSKASNESATAVTAAADKAPERPPASAATAVTREEPMIIVHVNDRLGTKAAIPCLASDPIKLFKAQVAARIGRQPHEILLKRQGERPFKDQLTLEDYGVSNGVQIDLEIDTGE